ncbi:MAG: PEP-CTERM sorting domain-containing protein [Verrucomicrobia bacterium]|nr:PEP-CTERM sorting domain-containing protein [Verrucomicrobiota bacterium]
MNLQSTLLAPVFAAVVASAPSLIHAASANVSPQSISVLSGTFVADTGNGSALDDAINRSGIALTPSEFAAADLSLIPHDTANAYEARLFSGPAATIRLDLGDVFRLETAYFWNNNSIANNNVGDYGYTFRSADLSALGSSPWLSASNVIGSTAMADVYALSTPIDGIRYIDIAMNIRSGNSLNNFGVGEVGYRVAPSVPEPTSVGLLIVGTPFILWRRWRASKVMRARK